MATILEPQQQNPYLPLLAQAGGSFLIPLFTNLGNQIFDPNRGKESAFTNFAAQQIAAGGAGSQSQQNPAQPVDYSMSTPMLNRFNAMQEGQQLPMEGGFGIPQSGYSAQMPWETLTKPQASRQMTIADILAGVDQKRFKMIPAETQINIVDKLLAAQQKEQQRENVQELLNSNFDPNNIAQLISLLNYGGIDSAGMGHVLSSANKRYEFDNPHLSFNTVDTGGRTTGLAFNPRTGDAVENWFRNNEMSPYQSASIGVQRERNVEKPKQIDPVVRLEIQNINNELSNIWRQIAAEKRKNSYDQDEGYLKGLYQKEADLLKRRDVLLGKPGGNSIKNTDTDPIDLLDPETVKAARAAGFTDEQIRAWAIERNVRF